MNDSHKAYERDKVIKIIGSVIQKVEKDKDISREAIAQQLMDLRQSIQEMRTEINQMSAGDIAAKDIPTATDELDAVVDATASATGSIMDACEQIETTTAEIDPAHAEQIQDQVVKIYEACSFQDITGQRISKVVKTLRTIEEKVATLLAAMGGEDTNAQGSSTQESVSPNDEQSLLNGPQMPENAINQEEIDKLLAEFDD
jgi:chemotaxis protein CheZ